MADPIHGLTTRAANQVGQVVRQVLRTLPATGHRTRRVHGPSAGVILFVANEDFIFASLCPDVEDCGPSGCLDYTTGLCSRLTYDDSQNCKCYVASDTDERVYDLDPTDPPLEGDRIYAMRNRDSGRWEAVRVIRMATFFCCPCDDPCMNGTFDITIDGVTQTINLSLAMGLTAGQNNCVWGNGYAETFGTIRINSAVLTRSDTNEWILTVNATRSGGSTVVEDFRLTQSGCGPVVLVINGPTAGTWPGTITMTGGECDPPPACPCSECWIVTSIGWDSSALTGGGNCLEYIQNYNGSYGVSAPLRTGGPSGAGITLIGGACGSDSTPNTGITVLFDIVGCATSTQIAYSSNTFDCSDYSPQTLTRSSSESSVTDWGGNAPETITVTPTADCYYESGGGGGACGNCRWVWCAATGDPIAYPGISCGDSPRTPSWVQYAGCDTSTGSCGCPSPGRDGAYHGELVTVSCTGAP